jgi:hypothetical protein
MDQAGGTKIRPMISGAICPRWLDIFLWGYGGETGHQRRKT